MPDPETVRCDACGSPVSRGDQVCPRCRAPAPTVRQAPGQPPGSPGSASPPLPSPVPAGNQVPTVLPAVAPQAPPPGPFPIGTVVDQR
ncbi:MAG: hypothetical protein HYZ53_24550 [Planctomycetes bacterium]|nr:hypothetical protein [Planctomycetota bacterium]